MTLNEIRQILSEVRYLDWKFEAGNAYDDGFLDSRKVFWVRVSFSAPDRDSNQLKGWNGRKWIISEHATQSEVVQTALLAVKTAVEHELREAFTYRGAAIFGPHFDVEKLVGLCRRHDALDERPDHREGQHATAD